MMMICEVKIHVSIVFETKYPPGQNDPRTAPVWVESEQPLRVKRQIYAKYIYENEFIIQEFNRCSYSKMNYNNCGT